MGLGKTVQVVCVLKSILREGLNTGPALVVAPKSILLQWEKVHEEFLPLHYYAYNSFSKIELHCNYLNNNET
jgi:SNF2 family DNA or RNA helicase